MNCFHRTARNNADAILSGGFKDSTGSYMTSGEHSGVFISDVPLDVNEGARGDTLLLVEIEESAIAEYEWIEDEKPYREFCVPSSVLNTLGRVRIFTEEEEDALSQAEE